MIFWLLHLYMLLETICGEKGAKAVCTVAAFIGLAIIAKTYVF